MWSYAGVRPLADSGQENASAVTRDYVFDLDAPEGGAPSLSIFGGKLTTFRKLAEHALRDLSRALGEARPAWTADAAIPGGDLGPEGFDGLLTRLAAERPWLPKAQRLRMARAYGSRVDLVLGHARAWADLGRDYGAGLTEAELDHLRHEEWARTAEDVLWRRSKLGLHMTPAQREAVASAMGG